MAGKTLEHGRCIVRPGSMDNYVIDIGRGHIKLRAIRTRWSSSGRQLTICLLIDRPAGWIEGLNVILALVMAEKELSQSVTVHVIAISIHVVRSEARGPYRSLQCGRTRL